MIKLGLNLPPMSQVVAERRRHEREAEQAALTQQAALARRKAQSMQRTYQAARVDRLTNDWTTIPRSSRWEIYRSLRIMRARVRDLARNNDHIKKFLSMVRTNVVGPSGIKLQVRAKNTRGEMDSLLNRQIEEAWATWSHAENASVNGKLSWRDALRKFVSTLARDGEALVRMISADNPFGFSLKFIDVNWLDEHYNETLPGGNRVIMSVEINDDDKPVAYWLTPPVDEYALRSRPSMRRRTRVPAEEMIHCFLMDDENSGDDTQTRGVPWAHTAMMRLHILGAYEEAELIAARIGASKMGFFIPPAADPLTGVPGEATDGDHPMIDGVSPGTFQELAPGYTFEAFDPQHPNANVTGFVKAMLRGVSTGLDVSYCSLANDLEGVNFSSIRAGLLEERDIWRSLQAFVIEHFCRRVYIAWLKSSMLTGVLNLRPRDLQRVSEPVWRPRGWAWVDPKKDMEANVGALDNALATHTDILAEQGEDFEEKLILMKEEQDLADKYGVKLRHEKTPAAPSALDPEDEQNS
ncbi:MAG TPA: phage portal protein [Pyrinomonadaceae bacterium]|jgi:lambda family phage portal protein